MTQRDTVGSLFEVVVGVAGVGSFVLAALTYFEVSPNQLMAILPSLYFAVTGVLLAAAAVHIRRGRRALETTRTELARALTHGQSLERRLAGASESVTQALIDSLYVRAWVSSLLDSPNQLKLEIRIVNSRSFDPALEVETAKIELEPKPHEVAINDRGAKARFRLSPVPTDDGRPVTSRDVTGDVHVHAFYALGVEQREWIENRPAFAFFRLKTLVLQTNHGRLDLLGQGTRTDQDLDLVLHE